MIPVICFERVSTTDLSDFTGFWLICFVLFLFFGCFCVLAMLSRPRVCASHCSLVVALSVCVDGFLKKRRLCFCGCRFFLFFPFFLPPPPVMKKSDFSKFWTASQLCLHNYVLIKKGFNQSERVLWLFMCLSNTNHIHSSSPNKPWLIRWREDDE